MTKGEGFNTEKSRLLYKWIGHLNTDIVELSYFNPDLQFPNNLSNTVTLFPLKKFGMTPIARIPNHHIQGAILRRIAKDQTEDEIIWQQSAQKFLKAKSFEQAIETCNEGLEKHADNTQLLMLKASALVRISDPMQAASVYGKVIDIAPEMWQAHFNLGAVLERQGKTSKAVHHFKKALKLDPPEKQKKMLQQKLSYYGKKR